MSIHVLIFLFRPHLWGQELDTQMGSLFRQFWPNDIFILDKCEWYHLKARAV